MTIVPNMSIKYWCSRCGRSYTTTAEYAGKQAKCRICGHVQRIPDRPLETVGADTYAVAAAETSAERPADVPARQPRLKPRPPRQRFWTNLIRASIAEPSRLQGLSVCLLALSAADLFMTFTLLKTSQTFYESNPVAQWFFQRWNMAGMVMFKFGVIGGVIALGEYIERKRPGRGRFVLMVGCVAAAVVVWHGLRLYLNHGIPVVVEGN